uniref:Uncharacterized protein n=1 Tax=Timema monikensis TaxID=170555 RepID=A0A7R9EKR4_9NEOP|nr:unnamed protein product [Timema monikensis]
MIHKTMMNDKSPGYYTKQYVKRKSQALKCASKRRLEFKMEGRNPPVKRKKVSCGLDQDYSLLEEEYSLAMDDDEHLVKNMNSFLNNLSLTEVQRNPLERDTVEQSSCPKWKIERMKRLTASNFGKICHLKSVTSKKNTDHALLYCSVGTKAMQYGIDNEPFAKAMLQLQMNINVTNCGLFVDKDQPFLVASPMVLSVTMKLLKSSVP